MREGKAKTRHREMAQRIASLEASVFERWELLEQQARLRTDAPATEEGTRDRQQAERRAPKPAQQEGGFAHAAAQDAPAQAAQAVSHPQNANAGNPARRRPPSDDTALDAAWDAALDAAADESAQPQPAPMQKRPLLHESDLPHPLRAPARQPDDSPFFAPMRPFDMPEKRFFHHHPPKDKR